MSKKGEFSPKINFGKFFLKVQLERLGLWCENLGGPAAQGPSYATR